MKIPGDEDPRVTDGIHVLKGVSHGHDMGLGGRIAVVGGGNVAMDVARTALRVGAEEVNIIYRRTRAEMPADPEEIEESYNEGVQFNYLVNPVGIKPQGDQIAVTCIRMELGEPDASGRRRPVPVQRQRVRLRGGQAGGGHRPGLRGARGLRRRDRQVGQPCRGWIHPHDQPPRASLPAATWSPVPSR